MNKQETMLKLLEYGVEQWRFTGNFWILDEIILIDKYLQNFDFQGSHMNQITMLHCDARNANFQFVSMTDSNLFGTDFRGGNFTGADLSYTDLTDVIGREEIVSNPSVKLLDY